MFPYEKEEARLSGYRAELVIQRPRVRVLTCLLAVGISLGGPEFKSLATIVTVSYTHLTLPTKRIV